MKGIYLFPVRWPHRSICHYGPNLVLKKRRANAGFIFLGMRGYSNVKGHTMCSATKKVLDQAKDMVVCNVPQNAGHLLR